MTKATDGIPPVAAIVLAAGKGTRFAAAADGAFKLLASLDGMPMVRRVVETAQRSRVRDVIVVTGHERDDVMTALSGLPVREIRNPFYGDGLSTSLRAGIASLSPDVAGAVVLLADMPRVNAGVVDALIAAFQKRPDARAVVPLYGHRRGNPVLLARTIFPAVERLTGDEGARRLLSREKDVVEIAIDDIAITLDVDTPDALSELR